MGVMEFFFDFWFFLRCTSGISEEPVSETSCASPQRALLYNAGLFCKRALANRLEMYQKRLMQFEIYLQRSSAQHPNAPYITVQGTPMLHALLCTPQRVHTSTPMLHALQAAPQRSMHTVQVEKRPMKET